MAIDTAEKRKSLSGIGGLFFNGPGMTPNASPDAEWRLEAGHSYPGIAALNPDTQFTNFRIEANAPGSATLRWTYGGAASTIQVWRSTDGSTFSFVSEVASSVTTFTNTGLDKRTLYYYKLTDDLGTTFSTIVTVVTYASSRRLINQTPQRVNRVVTHVDPQDFNDLVSETESRIYNSADSTEPCVVCSFNGAAVFDCSTQCKQFRMIVTENINSISIIGCDPFTCPTIEFVIPPNTTREICGWPVGCEYIGSECFDAPIEGGTNGTTVFSNGISFPGTGSPLGPGSSGPCPCTATLGLNIQCCSDNCALNCSTNPVTTLKACGGVAPYTWTKTGGVVLSPNGATCQVAAVPGRSNYTGSASDIAFVRLGYGYADCPTTLSCAAGGLRGGTTYVGPIGECYNCDMVLQSQSADCANSHIANWTCPSAAKAFSLHGIRCSDGADYGLITGCSTIFASEGTSIYQSGSHEFTASFGGEGGFSASGKVPVTPVIGAECRGLRVLHDVVDVRTPTMIANGCAVPCEASVLNSTVTVTDGTGASVTRVMS